jgi:hypothetical protein
MVKYDEGHGFGREANRIELYKSMMGFCTVPKKKKINLKVYLWSSFTAKSFKYFNLNPKRW